MKQEQYEAMQIIMQCGRSFAQIIENSMKNHGLIDKGFYFKVYVAKSVQEEYGTYLDVSLEQFRSDVGDDDHKKNRMNQSKLGNGSWKIYADPKAETGTVPENYGGKTTTDDSKGVAEDTRHPYPPDNLWLSSRDDYPVLGGGQ